MADKNKEFPCIQTFSKAGGEISFGVPSDTFDRAIDFTNFAKVNNLEINKRFKFENSDCEKIPTIHFTKIKVVFLTEPYIFWFMKAANEKFPTYYREYTRISETEVTKSETKILCLLIGGTVLNDEDEEVDVDINPTVFKFTVQSNNSQYFLFDSKMSQKKQDKIGCGFADFKKQIVKSGKLTDFVAELYFSKKSITVGQGGSTSRIHKIMFNVKNEVKHEVDLNPFSKRIDRFKVLMQDKIVERNDLIIGREEYEKTFPSKFGDELAAAKTPSDCDRLLADLRKCKKNLAYKVHTSGLIYDKELDIFKKKEVE